MHPSDLNPVLFASVSLAPSSFCLCGSCTQFFLPVLTCCKTYNVVRVHLVACDLSELRTKGSKIPSTSPTSLKTSRRGALLDLKLHTKLAEKTHKKWVSGSSVSPWSVLPRAFPGESSVHKQEHQSVLTHASPGRKGRVPVAAAGRP